MRKSLIGPSQEGSERRNQQRPWVHRTRLALSPVSILLIATLLFVAAIMVLASSACTTQSAVSTETDNFTVGDSITLKVETLGGRIEVDRWLGQRCQGAGRIERHPPDQVRSHPEW